jgi:hypothetical protein
VMPPESFRLSSCVRIAVEPCHAATAAWPVASILPLSPG